MEMSMLGRRELTNVVRLRYSRADRTQQSKILDQFVANTGYCRKYAIGLLGRCTLSPSWTPWCSCGRLANASAANG